MEQEHTYEISEGLNELVLSANYATTRSLGQEAKWTFYNPDCPYKMMFSLHQAFSRLRTYIPGSKANFLDCGSGNGIPSLLAFFSGFNNVSGIEKSRKLADDSRKRLASFIDKKFIPINAVHFAHGSYYRRNLLPDIISRCRKKLLEMSLIEGLEGTTNFVDYVRAVFGTNHYASVEELISRYIYPYNADAFDRLGILCKGKLNTDLVYTYPSDIFFGCAFLPQMALLMKKSSVLAILGPLDDPISISLPELKEREPILFPDKIDTNMCLQVFQKE